MLYGCSTKYTARSSVDTVTISTTRTGHPQSTATANINFNPLSGKFSAIDIGTSAALERRIVNGATKEI